MTATRAEGMALEETPDLRNLRSTIPWRDLVPLRWWEKTWELTLGIPWLLASLWCYQHHHFPAAATASFFFFLTGLRQSHNAQHYALGIPRLAHDLLLAILSILMLSSMHAVQVTHLHHHRHCLEEDDIEAAHANDKWWRVLLLGPIHPWRLHTAALKLGSREKRTWITIEITLALLAAVLTLILGPACLKWHLAAMAAGECMTGFFAVWTVHHGCNEKTIARTQRGLLKNLLSYSMFYHLEHHLFPAVPTTHLATLAARLDHATPHTPKHNVF